MLPKCATKDNAASLAFAVADIRSIRTEPMGALAMVNDTEHPANEDYLGVLRAYDILPVFWSRRQEAVELLNGR